MHSKLNSESGDIHYWAARIVQESAPGKIQTHLSHPSVFEAYAQDIQHMRNHLHQECRKIVKIIEEDPSWATEEEMEMMKWWNSYVDGAKIIAYFAQLSSFKNVYVLKGQYENKFAETAHLEITIEQAMGYAQKLILQVRETLIAILKKHSTLGQREHFDTAWYLADSFERVIRFRNDIDRLPTTPSFRNCLKDKSIVQWGSRD